MSLAQEMTENQLFGSPSLCVILEEAEQVPIVKACGEAYLSRMPCSTC
jgi:hypothetical protein